MKAEEITRGLKVSENAMETPSKGHEMAIKTIENIWRTLAK